MGKTKSKGKERIKSKSTMKIEKKTIEIKMN